MFCQSCGAPTGNSAVAAACAKCGFEAPGNGAAAAKELGNQVKSSSRDAADVLKQLLVDPVGGLGAAYAGLGADRALSAGVALSVAFALAGATGVTMGMSQWLGSLTLLVGTSEGLGAFLKLTIQLLVLPVAIATACLGIRSVAGARSPVAADMFTAGAALAPLGVALLIAGLMGVRNVEIAIVVFFFAVTYLVLMLYAGFTRAGGMSEKAAAPAVPAVLLLAAWLAKAIFSAAAGPFF